jgi:dolichol-phosphate mannosyltransferase
VSSQRLISISIPVFNEQENIDRLYGELVSVATSLSSRFDFEFVFTDNHSSDDSWPMIKRLATSDSRVKGFRFTRNIGFQKSILMNYSFTSGAAVIQIDADLQDPPSMFADFLDEWEKGARVVYGVRRVRKEGAVNGMIRSVGYWAIDRLSEHPIPRDAGDFRLLDRRVITALLAQNNPRPYIRGTIAGMGFDSVGIEYERAARLAGESKFPLSKVFKLGIEAIFNNSIVPLRMAIFFGGLFLVASLAMIVWIVISKLSNPHWPEGYASLFSVILFGFGVIAMLVGIIGEYILRIYISLRAEPIGFVADSTVDY